jgi:hypothetical protein
MIQNLGFAGIMLANAGIDSKKMRFHLFPLLPIAGMSAVARWVFGRDRGDLPIMERSEMTPKRRH